MFSVSVSLYWLLIVTKVSEIFTFIKPDKEISNIELGFR